MHSSTAISTKPTLSSSPARVATAARSATSSANVYDTIWQCAADATSRGVALLTAEDEVLDERLVHLEGRTLVNLGSCSYLGLQREPSIIHAIEDAARRFGSQFSSSRAYLSISQYAILEELLDQIFERPTLACPSTTLGHMSALPVLIKDDDAVILDQQVHHSVQTAAQLVKARGVPLHVVRHNRMDRLEALVQQLEAKHDRVWILVDGVYSMYGDVAPVHELVGLLERHRKAWLYVDDAHGMGWAGRHGRGYVRSQIDHHERMVLAASLNKSFAAAGGVLVFPSAELRDRVRGCGPTMIFSGPIQPPMLGAAIASARLHLSPALELAQRELEALIRHTNRRIAELGLPQVAVSETPLFFIPAGLPRVVYRLVRCLMDDGFFVNAGSFPAVPIKQGGIRFAVHRGLRAEDIDAMLERLAHHYHRVLADEGSSLEDLRRTFRMTGIVVPEARRRAAPLQLVQEPALRLRHAASIHEVDPAWWDARMAGRGPMTHAALAMMEEVFSRAPEPEQRAELGYAWVEDEQGRVVLSTMFSVCLIKEDMFARARVSEKLEAIRRGGDPHFLVAKAVVLGTPLSLGEHLVIDRRHPRWAQALAHLVEHLQAVKQRAGASQILLRDFPLGADEALRSAMFELGFFEHRLPDLMQISDMRWSDRAGYLASLGHKYRYNVRKEAIAYEDRFVVETAKDCPDEVIEQCYALYRAVHARSVKLNVFPLPLELFRAAFAHPEYDVIRLYLRSAPERPVAVLLSHRTQDLYSALVVGLDDEHLHEHKTYKQILFQCVERARALGATRMNLAFTAELEKKKLGARPQPTCAFVQMDDDYAAVVMESL
ncbi:MAG: aminotransferase class I/II-fold pyridoxal phosphate-dependent enzyme [Myxococcales bacterium]|nr:aminotransferase class I/II-fold pyridoxal phosphate-dependent enzyme [Myxococcales bacterium]